MSLFAQAAAPVPAPTITIDWGPILLLGCGGALLLFAVVAVVIILVASNSRREDR